MAYYLRLPKHMPLSIIMLQPSSNEGCRKTVMYTEWKKLQIGYMRRKQIQDSLGIKSQSEVESGIMLEMVNLLL